MTPPQSQIRPLPKGRGTVWPSRSSGADHRLPRRRHTKLVTCNEADRHVYEPGLAGQKPEVTTSPVSRST